MSDDQKQNPSYSANGTGVNGYGYYGGEYYAGERTPDGSGTKNEIDLKQLLATIIRYKWWVVAITIGCTVLAYTVAKSIQPIYQSSGSLLIAEERNRYSWGGTDLSSMMSSSFGVGAGSRLTNELQILRSRTLADEIAQKVMEIEELPNGSQFPILFKEYPTDSTQADTSTVALRVMGNIAVNQINPDTDVLNISYSSPSPHEAKFMVDLIMETYSTVSARQRRSMAQSALDFLREERGDIRERLTRAEEELRDYMRNTNLVQVDGQTGAAINRVAELESQKQEVQVQRVAVTSSIESYENQLNQIRPGLAEQFAQSISSQLSNAQMRLAELRTERSLILQRNPELRNNPEMEPQLVQLEQEIENVRDEIRNITGSVLNADDSDIYIGFLDQEDGGVTDRIVELRRKLIELRIQDSQLDAQERVINQRLSEENEFFDDLPENMLELARLRREVAINEELFTAVSSKFQETQIWEQTQYGAGRVIDEGFLPAAPSHPQTLLFVLIGFLVGGVLSTGTVALREVTNRNIDGTDKVVKTGYPLLGVIPHFGDYLKERYNGADFVKKDEKRISTSWTSFIDSISPITESYRRLHNNIVYSDPDKEFQTILVTSSRKSEGKSTVSINLAVAFAESGKRVLLVDADLRRPNLHRLMGEGREPGLAEIFYENFEMDLTIKKTMAPGVDVITSGGKIPNPSALMHSQKMSHFLDEVKSKYDHIILDTPPFGVITDAAPMIRNMADGIVLVAKFNDTEMNELNHAVQNLKCINANVIGVVLTAYKHKKSRDYYY
ncbi:MAG: polysaccharide biosynthesis tyrosine autokinase, partial [Bacteroidetes bacterium]|nr:polysaccharide biosynthesis tyrosine autokinase [Bacteroidota bacterium]